MKADLRFRTAFRKRTFRESAHSPVFEEPDKVMTILREDVLNGTNRLADSRQRSRTS
jgi:hypothetical protein